MTDFTYEIMFHDPADADVIRAATSLAPSGTRLTEITFSDLGPEAGYHQATVVFCGDISYLELDDEEFFDAVEQVGRVSRSDNGEE